MTNLVDIQSQIEKLQLQAAQIKEKEFDATVRDIVSKMAAFGITVRDLQAASAGGRKKGARKSKIGTAPKRGVKKGAGKSKLAGSSVAAKFRGPNGETWSGRGLMPKWLSALVAGGRTKEEFAV
jgi:DNA-binding protein H-NS